MSKIEIRAGGNSHEGNVRETNEDSLLVDPDLGLYGVFDGVGGHQAGEVASQMARDLVHAQISAGVAVGRADGRLLEEALRAASRAVNDEAKRRRHRRGMGTTAVVALVTGGTRVLLAHVGDSRAYLLRDGRLQQLTADHTIVAELLEKHAISPDEALRHPYRNVLSRNLGGQPDTRVDVQELSLAEGAKLLLCSDGLNGFASHEAMQQVLAGSAKPVEVAQELVELARKGGGGDNVTAVVVEAVQKELPRRTLIVRTSGAAAWWGHRDLFLSEAGNRGVVQSPVCSGLGTDEAIQVVAGKLHEALYHDLEQTTGIHVWTYAENLASGWLDNGGSFSVLRDLLDALYASCQQVINALSDTDLETAQVIEVAVWRELAVAEMAVAGLLAKHMRNVERQVVDAHARKSWPQVFTDHPTVRMEVPHSEPPAPELVQCLDRALALAVDELCSDAACGLRVAVHACVERAHIAAVHHAGQMDGALAAQELFGTTELGDSAVTPLLDALDRARRCHLSAVRTIGAAPVVTAAAVSRVAAAHLALFSATARIVVESGCPVTEQLMQVAEATAALRLDVARNEQQIARMERRLHTQPGWAPEDFGK